MAEGQREKPKKLLDQVCGVLRLHHYAIRTEKSYCDWIRRYIAFHRMQSRADLAVVDKVAAATQRQALNAIVFLYGEVLGADL